MCARSRFWQRVILQLLPYEHCLNRLWLHSTRDLGWTRQRLLEQSLPCFFHRLSRLHAQCVHGDDNHMVRHLFSTIPLRQAQPPKEVLLRRVQRCAPSLPDVSCSVQALLFQVQLPLDQPERLIIDATPVA